MGDRGIASPASPASLASPAPPALAAVDVSADHDKGGQQLKEALHAAPDAVDPPSALAALRGRPIVAKEPLTPEVPLLIWGHDRAGHLMERPGTYACVAQVWYGTTCYYHLVRWEDREAALQHQRAVEQIVLRDPSALRRLDPPPVRRRKGNRNKS